MSKKETIRAKFKCTSIENFENSKLVKLNAVTDGSPENKSFAKATPYGNINLGIDKGTAASNNFEPGKEYYIDITEVEEITEGSGN